MVSVLKFFGIEKSIGIGFETFLCFLIVSVSVSKNFGIDKSIGIGFDFFWYRKKYRYRFRKNLVSKKVSVSVSEKIWYRKKYRIRYRKNLVSEKSFGFGFVQILGFVTHWCGGEPSLLDKKQKRPNLPYPSPPDTGHQEALQLQRAPGTGWVGVCGGGGVGGLLFWTTALTMFGRTIKKSDIWRIKLHRAWITHLYKRTWLLLQ